MADTVVTVRDIAARVGVSVTTVSNVLNGRPNVGRETRAAVLRAARELGYRPNRAAQAMRTGRTRALGLVLPDLTNPFFPELAQAVEHTARRAGLLVCLIDSQGTVEGEADGFALLMQHAVDGIIWCPLGPRQPRHLREFRGPIVLVDRPRPGYDVVQSDYAMGGRLLADHALAMGHGVVGLLSGPEQIESARQRRDGFTGAHPRALRVAWEVHVGFDGVLTPAAVDALTHRRGATLIVCGNDLIAISAIRCLTGLGVAVPGEVSVTGFDNIRWTDLVTPRLTTIAQPLGPIGAKAVEVMRERMSGAPHVGRRTLFDVALVERDSVRRLARRERRSVRGPGRARLHRETT
ncbi:MAG: LacI family DNA-binding transcriptional regulator [Proteobacteria bacterium]|nr:LacI family DNA-binding transcriptional regulator [Pseudomonadota bacterium]